MGVGGRRVEWRNGNKLVGVFLDSTSSNMIIKPPPPRTTANPLPPKKPKKNPPKTKKHQNNNTPSTFWGTDLTGDPIGDVVHAVVHTRVVVPQETQHGTLRPHISLINSFLSLHV